MRTAGIIAEYNPFHNGHAWQIAELKKRGFEAVVCVCSPGRGAARYCGAVFPPRWLPGLSLAAGADLVLSLPAPYATLSAEGFAAAGCALLSALRLCGMLCVSAQRHGGWRISPKPQRCWKARTFQQRCAGNWTRACRSPPPARRRREALCPEQARCCARP